MAERMKFEIPEFYDYYKYVVIWKDKKGKEQVIYFCTRDDAKESDEFKNKNNNAKIVKINDKFKSTHFIIT